LPITDPLDEYSQYNIVLIPAMRIGENVSRIKTMTKRDPIESLEAALDASIQENLRLARELADAEEGTAALIELLGLLIETWRNEGDLEPVVDQVAEEMKRLRSVH